jgi:hypothetical protein
MSSSSFLHVAMIGRSPFEMQGVVSIIGRFQHQDSFGTKQLLFHEMVTFFVHHVCHCVEYRFMTV